jgi:hypothetical protein
MAGLQSPAMMVNQIRAKNGIPIDSLRFENALDAELRETAASKDPVISVVHLKGAYSASD